MQSAKESIDRLGGKRYDFNRVLKLAGLNESTDVEIDVDDKIDGPNLTNELLDRVERLDLESVAADKLDALIEDIGKKDIDEKDVALLARAKRVAALLIEAKKRKVVTSSGKIQIQQVKTGKAKADAHRAYLKTRNKQKIGRKKYSKSVGARKLNALKDRKSAVIDKLKTRLGVGQKQEGADEYVSYDEILGARLGDGPIESKLGKELRGLLAESNDENAELGEAVERFRRIFGLLDAIWETEDVRDVMVDVTVKMEKVKDDEAEFMEAAKGALKVMGKMLSELEAAGFGELGNG